MGKKIDAGDVSYLFGFILVSFLTAAVIVAVCYGLTLSGSW